MLKTLKNQDGFTGLIGLIIAMVVIGIMSAMILPTFTAKMNYKQAKYTAGVIQTIENAENAYMAKNNGSFAGLETLASAGYLSSAFLQSVQGSYPNNNNWVSSIIGNQTVGICIENYSGNCPNNPGVGANGYFMGIYNIPPNYQSYLEHELPGSGSVGTGQVSYIAPVPTAPPVGAVTPAVYAAYAANIAGAVDINFGGVGVDNIGSADADITAAYAVASAAYAANNGSSYAVDAVTYAGDASADAVTASSSGYFAYVYADVAYAAAYAAEAVETGGNSADVNNAFTYAGDANTAANNGSTAAAAAYAADAFVYAAAAYAADAP